MTIGFMEWVTYTSLLKQVLTKTINGSTG